MLSLISTTRDSGLCLLRSIECLQTQTVRWRRIPKPYWLGVAKTKRFKFPPLVQRPKDEEEEYRRLQNHYKTYSRSFREFMKERYSVYEAKEMSEARETTEEAEYDRICSEIEKDNAAVRVIREECLVKEWSETKSQILELKHKYEEEERLKREEAEKKFLSEMDRLKTAITAEKLDEAIEKALSNEVDYNFAIDKKGNTFNGRNTHAR